MNIDENDYKRVMDNFENKFSSKKILNAEKYFYWDFKTNEYLDLMTENRNDADKYADYYHRAMCCMLERNKYQLIKKHDLLMLKTVLIHHNSVNKDKQLHCDKLGRRVKK